ncbi:MAG: ASCH domain-containing protein [Proteobacteria bacterium]|nr:ASCH domain-containing protein [Pseudomonadota bacterium]
MAAADKTPQTEAFWQAFVRQSGVAADYQIVAFGDGPALATELADLVVAGTKRATASLARDYADGVLPLPAVGDLVVVVDGAGAPRCIWRTTEITIQPLAAVDDRFAWDEGEGDRSRAWWLAAHRRYFARQAAREGFAFDDTIATVFERFTVVWPAEIAD